MYWFKNRAHGGRCEPHYLISYLEVEKTPKDHWKKKYQFDPDLERNIN